MQVAQKTTTVHKFLALLIPPQLLLLGNKEFSVFWPDFRVHDHRGSLLFSGDKSPLNVPRFFIIIPPTIRLCEEAANFLSAHLIDSFMLEQTRRNSFSTSRLWYSRCEIKAMNYWREEASSSIKNPLCGDALLQQKELKFNCFEKKKERLQ